MAYVQVPKDLTKVKKSLCGPGHVFFSGNSQKVSQYTDIHFHSSKKFLSRIIRYKL